MAALRRTVKLLAPSFCRTLQKTTTTNFPKQLICNHQLRHQTQKRSFCSGTLLHKKETVVVHFIQPDGDRLTADAKVGDNLLDVVVENDLDIDGFGACEGTLACSTCHLVFTQEQFSHLPDKPTDEELDMLDLAYGLCDTSRLGCQVIVSKDMDGWEIKVPAGVADAREP